MMFSSIHVLFFSEKWEEDIGRRLVSVDSLVIFASHSHQMSYYPCFLRMMATCLKYFSSIRYLNATQACLVYSSKTLRIHAKI